MTEEFNIEISDALENNDLTRVTQLLQQIKPVDVNQPIRIYQPRHSRRFLESTPRRRNEESQRHWLQRVTYPLHLAMELALTEVTESLINKGADVNKTITSGDHQGKTPLTMAADDNNVPLVKLLLENSANPNIVPTDGEHKGKSPLWLALYITNDTIATLLLQNNADPNIAPTEGSNAGKTPLWLATNSGKVEVIKLLIEKNANVNVAPTEGGFKGKTSLFMAAVIENSEIAKILIKEGAADVNIADVAGVTPVMIATSKGNFELVDFLVHNLAKIGDIKNENWEKALKIAIEQGTEKAHKCVTFIKNAAAAESGLPLLYQNKHHHGPSKSASSDIFRGVLETLTGNKPTNPPKPKDPPKPKKPT